MEWEKEVANIRNKVSCSPQHKSSCSMLAVTTHSSCAFILWRNLNYVSVDFLPTSLPHILFHSIHKCHHNYFSWFCYGKNGSGFKAVLVTYMGDFREEDQACLQANTAEAWISDVSLICNGVALICSELCLSWQFLAAQCPTCEDDLQVGRTVIPFLIVILQEKETTSAKTFVLAIFSILEWSSKDCVSLVCLTLSVGLMGYTAFL